MRVCADWGFQVKCSGVLSAAVEPRRHCDVCVNSFTALRPPQLPSPLFITATEVIPAPHSLPKLLPHRRPIAALRVRWKCTIVGQKRGDIPTSSWKSPLPPERGVRDYGVQPACVYGGVFAWSGRNELPRLTRQHQHRRVNLPDHDKQPLPVVFQNKTMTFMTNYRSFIYQ